MKNLILSCLMLWASVAQMAWCQSSVFTNPQMAWLNLNPSFPGIVNGPYKMGASISGRTQFDLSRVAYHTLNGEFSTRIGGADISIENVFSVGGSFLVDQNTGFRNYAQQRGHIYGAYSRFLSQGLHRRGKMRTNESLILSIGGGVGLINHGLINGSWVYDDQYDPDTYFFEASNNTSETLRSRAILRPDFSAGLNLVYNREKSGAYRFTGLLGYAIQHLGRPELGLQGGSKFEQPMLHGIQGIAAVQLPKLTFKVESYYFRQGPSNALTLLGKIGRISKALTYKENLAEALRGQVFIGFGFRFTGLGSHLSPEALMINLTAKIGNVRFVVGYDRNINRSPIDNAVEVGLFYSWTELAKFCKSVVLTPFYF